METLENCVGPVTGYLQREVDVARSTQSQTQTTPSAANQGDKFATKELKQVQVISLLFMDCIN